MKQRKHLLLATLLLSASMIACMLPGMIPLNAEPEGPMPYLEEDTNRVIEVLQGGDWHALGSLATEQYAEEDYAKPGTLTYTVTIADELPIYFSYGWCAVDEETLRQNFEHIHVSLHINGDELPSNAVHNLTFTSPTGLLCLDFGVLMSDWTDGEYKLEAVATFEEEINDGLADFATGDYAFVYNVTVKK